LSPGITGITFESNVAENWLAATSRLLASDSQVVLLMLY